MISKNSTVFFFQIIFLYKIVFFGQVKKILELLSLELKTFNERRYDHIQNLVIAAVLFSLDGVVAHLKWRAVKRLAKNK